MNRKFDTDAGPDHAEMQVANRRHRMDWMEADLRGEVRTLAWYIGRAEAGDRDAALRALELCVGSLSPAALKQNRWLMTPDLADALRKILGPAAQMGDSAVLRTARGVHRFRVPDVNTANITWWRCFEMHKKLKDRSGLSQIKAAAEVLDGQAGQPASLQKRYRNLKPALEIYWQENAQDAGATAEK